ncbi:hypothetical protein ACVGWB_10670 [Enterobacter mori]
MLSFQRFWSFSLFNAVNAVIVGEQKDKPREITHTLLSYSENLSQHVASALEKRMVQSWRHG